MPEGWWPRRVTPSLRSWAAAESTRLLRRRNSQEELPCVRGRGERRREDTQRLRSGVAGGRSYLTPPRPRPGAAARRSNPTPEARGGGWEDQPHVHGAVAMRVQEGLEELAHVEGQEGWRWGDTKAKDSIYFLTVLIKKIHSLVGYLKMVTV